MAAYGMGLYPNSLSRIFLLPPNLDFVHLSKFELKLIGSETRVLFILKG